LSLLKTGRQAQRLGSRNWVINTIEFYLLIKRERERERERAQLSSHEKTYRGLYCMLLNERKIYIYDFSYIKF
jgi:hypothetical protein